MILSHECCLNGSSVVFCSPFYYLLKKLHEQHTSLKAPAFLVANSTIRELFSCLLPISTRIVVVQEQECKGLVCCTENFAQCVLMSSLLEIVLFWRYGPLYLSLEVIELLFVLWFVFLLIQHKQQTIFAFCYETISPKSSQNQTLFVLSCTHNQQGNKSLDPNTSSMAHNFCTLPL